MGGLEALGELLGRACECFEYFLALYVGGEPDFHYHYLINHLFLRIDEELLGDGHSYSPRAIHSWLTRAMYSRRSKMNPLWNTMVIGGYADGERYL